MLLALDTSTPLVAAAVHDGRRDAGPEAVRAHGVGDRPMRHGELLAPLVERLLAEAEVARTDLTGIAVGTGPGPFTGLRVGLVTARTLGAVLDVPVTGVCSLDVLAAEAAALGIVDGRFLVATDARRKEIYHAVYDVGAGGRCRREGDPAVARPADLAEELRTLPCVGPGPTLYPDDLVDARGLERPSASWLARIVVDGLAPTMAPEPLYLRRPDAVASAARKPVS